MMDEYQMVDFIPCECLPHRGLTGREKHSRNVLNKHSILRQWVAYQAGPLRWGAAFMEMFVFQCTCLQHRSCFYFMLIAHIGTNKS